MQSKEETSSVDFFHRLQGGFAARHARTLLLVLVVISLLAGCGDDGGGGY